MKDVFLIAALALPGMFFLLHPFHWKATIATLGIVLIGIFGREFGGSWRFDEWLKGLRETFHVPNPWVLVISDDRKPSRFATFHLPEFWESVPYPDHLRNRFGMVLVDQSDPRWYEPITFKDFNRIPFTTEMLQYFFLALVQGGKLVIVEGRKPIIVIERNGK